MKKLLLLAAMVATLLVGCKNKSEVDPNYPIQVTLTLDESIDKSSVDLSTFTVKVTENKSGEEHLAKADETGKASFALPLGTYTVVAEDIIDGASTMYGRVDNVSVSKKDQIVPVKISLLRNVLDKTFVLDELYFNCNSNGFMGTYNERYFTIRNISDKVLYLDGLSFGVVGNYNTIPAENAFSEMLPDVVVLSQVYTFPGDGRTYKVEPNQSVVIAHSAINHKEGGEPGEDRSNSLDLSGADFEIYVPHEWSATVDNPEVENVLVDFSTFQAFYWDYSGSSPMVLFYIEGDRKAFIEQAKQKFENPMGFMEQDFIKLPSKWIIDGVETCAQGSLGHKGLPGFVDKSVKEFPGSGIVGQGFEGYFFYRKEIVKEDGSKTVQDTNDSANDYEVKKGGAKNYPAKK